MPSKETQKYITWGLIASTVVFLILSVVFICLFATKHEDSSSFLLTAFSSKNAGDANGEINRVLSGDYHVNSLQTDEKNGVVTSVFSLRGKQNPIYVQDRFSGNSILKNSIVTDGSNSNSVCHQFDQSVVIPTTEKPNTATEAETTTTEPVVIPPAHSFYCNSTKFKRDIYIVVDILPDPVDQENARAPALKTLGNKIADKLQFSGDQISEGAQVYIVAADDKGPVEVSTAFTTTVKGFQADWAKLVGLPGGPQTPSPPDMDKVFAYIKQHRGRPLTPVEVIVLTTHSFDLGSANNLKELGVFVSVVKATMLDISQALLAVSSTDLVDLTSWADVAAADPFAALVCQYYYQDNSAVKPPAPPALFVRSMLDAAPVDNTCQKVDIIFVFDTSQSVVPIFIQDYKDWSKQFVSRFTLTGAKDGDNVRVGIIQFSETATVLMPLQVTTQAAFDNVVDGIIFTGGLTNTKDALVLAKKQFDNVSNTHGKFVVFMTDGEPTVGTLYDSVAAGQALTTEADLFFIGDSGYDAATKDKLGQINGHPEWIYNTPADANILLPQTVLQLFPCPVPVCEVAYYAIEVSEATKGSNFVYASLKFVKQVANQVAQQKPNSLFQIMLYNDGTHFLPAVPSDIQTVIDILDNMLTNDGYLQGFMTGHTRLDFAINAISAVIDNQIFFNELFQSSVLFAGEANYYTLDPHCATFDDACEPQRKQELATAAAGLRARTNLVYAYDGSLMDKPHGDDLWPSAVDKSKIIDGQAKDPNVDLTSAKYYDNIGKLSCQMPVLDRCDYSILDIAVVLDVVGDDSKVKPYLESFLNQFKTTYSSHISMLAMGSGHPVTTLGSLGAYNSTAFSSEMFWEYERWRLGEAIYTTEAPTTEAATDAPPAHVHAAAGPSPMTTAVIKDMFAALQGQFGCGHYDEYHDRIRAPNVIVVVSDNFASYTPAIWNAFPDYVSENWTCDDCPGKPLFYFLSMTDDIPAHGTSWKIEGDDFDLTKAASIRKLSGIVDQVCVTPQPICTSFVPTTICLPTPIW